MKKAHLLSILLALCFIAGLLSGCGANSSALDDGDYAIAETWVAESSQEITGSTELAQVSAQNRKLVRRVRIEAETQDFDELMATLDEKITSIGGYVESRETDVGSSYYYPGSRYNRSCHMVIRIPADALNDFVTHVDKNANVTYTSETTEDITLQYVDTAARVEALKTEQARLLELLENAQNLTEILEIEERLSDVSYELESYASQMRTYDNLVDYATVNLNISEVQELTPAEEPSVWDRIRSGFSDSIHDISEGAVNLFVWFIAKLPKLIIWGAIIAAGAFLAHKIHRKKKGRNGDPQEPPANIS